MIFDKKLINSIKDILCQRGETIAVAESVSSGMLQLALSQADDAIHFYQGGITAYNIGQKTRHLCIDPIKGEKCNCVSQHTAQEMALNICRMFTSDWGLAITGYASPVPESGNRLFAYFAIVHHGSVKCSSKIVPEKDNPLKVQTAIYKDVLKQFHHLLYTDYAD